MANSESHEAVQLPELLERRWQWPDFDPASCQECGCAIPLNESAWLRDERSFCKTCYVAIEHQETARRQTAIELANKNALPPSPRELDAVSKDEGCPSPEIKKSTPQVVPPPAETLSPIGSSPSHAKPTRVEKRKWNDIREQVRSWTDLHHVTMRVEKTIESVQPDPVAAPVSDVAPTSFPENVPDVEFDAETTTEPTAETAEHAEQDLALPATLEQLEPADHSPSTSEAHGDAPESTIEVSPILKESPADSSENNGREHNVRFTLALPQVSPIASPTSQSVSDQNHDLDDAPSLPPDKPEIANSIPDEEEPAPVSPVPEFLDVPDESLEEVAEMISTVNSVLNSEHTQSESDWSREEIHPLDAIPELEIETPLPIDEDAQQRQAMLHQAAALRDHWFATPPTPE